MTKLVSRKDVRQPLTLPKRRCLHLCLDLCPNKINDSTLATPGGECQKNACEASHTKLPKFGLFDNNPNYSVTDSVSIVVVCKEITSGWGR